MHRESLPRSLWTFLAVTASLYLLCLLGVRFGSGQHIDAFATGPTFQDLRYFEPQFRGFHHMDFFQLHGRDPYVWPALAAVILECFYLFQPHEAAAFVLLSAATTIGATVLLTGALLRRNIALLQAVAFPTGTALVSWPLWFAFYLGNPEVVLWLLVILGVLALLRGWDCAAATMFGLAGAFKIYPIVLLALLLSKKNYRAFAAGVAAMLVATAASLWLACPFPALLRPGMHIGLDWFQRAYVLQPAPAWDHSLFAAVKHLVRLFQHGRGGQAGFDLQRTLFWYQAVTALSGVVLYFVRIRWLPLLNQLFVLSIVSVLAPPVSNDYTLLQLYVPWALLVLVVVDSAKRGVRVEGVWTIMALLAVLFAPELEIGFRMQTMNGGVKCVALLWLLWTTLRKPLPAVTGSDWHASTYNKVSAL